MMGSTMKALLALFAIAAMATPALAQQFSGAVIVMRYEAPDGSIKTLPSPALGETLSMEECQRDAPRQVRTLKRQLGNTRNFPEFAGWKFISGQCEMYSDDLITTVK